MLLYGAVLHEGKGLKRFQERSVSGGLSLQVGGLANQPCLMVNSPLILQGGQLQKNGAKTPKVSLPELPQTLQAQHLRSDNGQVRELLTST
ncbi:unnamed protein product [Gadus morhua 'NCC']